MMYPAFTETSIKPHPNFLTKRFLFNRGKRTRSYWRVHIITGGYQRRGERNQSCCHVMCAAGFAAAHDRHTFRRTSQFTNALIQTPSSLPERPPRQENLSPRPRPWKPPPMAVFFLLYVHPCEQVVIVMANCALRFGLATSPSSP